MRISQHALDAVHRLEEKVFGAKLTPQGRVLACDIVQKAIDIGDRQNEGPAIDPDEFFRNEPPHYRFTNGEWVRVESPQLQLELNTECKPGKG